MGMRESFFILGNTSSSLVIFFILKFALSAINIVFLASFQFYVTYFGNFSLWTYGILIESIFAYAYNLRLSTF